MPSITAPSNTSALSSASIRDKAAPDPAEQFNQAAEAMGQVLTQVVGMLNGGAAGFGKNDPMALLRMQEDIQNRSIAYQTRSNISKTEHDARMNTVRNVRA